MRRPPWRRAIDFLTGCVLSVIIFVLVVEIPVQDILAERNECLRLKEIEVLKQGRTVRGFHVAGARMLCGVGL